MLTNLQQQKQKEKPVDKKLIPIGDPPAKHTFMADGGFSSSAPLQRMQADLSYMSWTGDPTGNKQKGRRHPESYEKSRGMLYKYLLVIVDMYSTRTYLYPLTLKDEKNVSKAFQEFFESLSDRRLSGETMFLQTDRGTELYNPSMTRLYNHYKVDHYSTKANGGYAYASEKKIREIKRWFFKLRLNDKLLATGRGWVKCIREVETILNNTVNQKYAMTPDTLIGQRKW